MREIYCLSGRQLLLRCALLGLLITAGLFVPTINLIALCLVAVYLFRFSDEDALCTVFFLVSFSPIFKLQLGGFTFMNFVVMLAVVRRLIKLRGFYKENATVIFVSLAMYALAGSLRSSIKEWITFICYLLFALLWYSPKRTTYSFHKVLMFFSAGILFTSFLALMEDKIPRLPQIMSNTIIRISAGNYYRRFSGLESNPNYYSMSISVCIAAIMVLVLRRKATWIDYAILAGLIVFGMMTVSNSFLLALVLTLALFVMCSGVKTIKTTISGLLAISVLLFGAYLLLDKNVWSTIAFRLNGLSEADNMNTITSGRTDLHLRYLDYLFENVGVLLLGSGVGSGNLWYGASHNFYIDILYHLGFIGGLMYICYLKAVFFPSEANGIRKEMGKWIPLMVFGMRAFGINLIMREGLVFVLIICSMAVYDRELNGTI